MLPVHGPAGEGEDERSTTPCSVMLSSAQEEHFKVMRRKPALGTPGRAVLRDSDALCPVL